MIDEKTKNCPNFVIVFFDEIIFLIQYKPTQLKLKIFFWIFLQVILRKKSFGLFEFQFLSNIKSGKSLNG